MILRNLQRALEGNKKAWAPEPMLTLDTLHFLGALESVQVRIHATDLQSLAENAETGQRLEFHPHRDQSCLIVALLFTSLMSPIRFAHSCFILNGA